MAFGFLVILVSGCLRETNKELKHLKKKKTLKMMLRWLFRKEKWSLLILLQLAKTPLDVFAFLFSHLNGLVWFSPKISAQPLPRNTNSRPVEAKHTDAKASLLHLKRSPQNLFILIPHSP